VHSPVWICFSLEKASQAYSASCIYSISSMLNAKENRVHGNCIERYNTVTCVHALSWRCGSLTCVTNFTLLRL